MSKINQPANQVEFLPNNESFSRNLDFPENNNVPLEILSPRVQADYNIKNALLAQQRTRDLYQQERERAELEIENKKIDYENQRIFDERKDSNKKFYITIGLIVFLIIFFTIIFISTFSFLIYFGKEPLIIEIVRSNLFSSLFTYLGAATAGLLGSNLFQKMKKWKECEKKSKNE